MIFCFASEVITNSIDFTVFLIWCSDFNLSRLVTSPCQGVVGTPEYMDQGAHLGRQTFESDLIALGLTLGRLRGFPFSWHPPEFRDLEFDELREKVYEIKEQIGWDWPKWASQIYILFPVIRTISLFTQKKTFFYRSIQ